MEAWRHGGMEAWGHGGMGWNMGAWKHGGMEAWGHGSMGAWKHGGMRHGSGEAGKRGNIVEAKVRSTGIFVAFGRSDFCKGAEHRNILGLIEEFPFNIPVLCTSV